MGDTQQMLVIRFRRQTAAILYRDTRGEETPVSEHPFGMNADELTVAMVDQVKAGKPRVLFDLSRVDWFGSTAIGLLLHLWRETQEQGARATCVNLSDRVLSTFRATLVDQVLHISGSTEDGETYVLG